MRFARILTKSGEEKYGIVEPEENIVIKVISGNPLNNNFSETGEIIEETDIKEFLPPIQPVNIIALGLNYKEHAAESKMELPSAPVIFLKAATSVTGHKSNIVLPASAPDEVDYEAELVVIIGKKAKNITKEQAPDYIFGYTCGNDVSARDCQLKYDKQWARGKSFDTFCPLGPWIETEVSNPESLDISCKLNGEIMQQSNTSYMIFGVFETVSYLSHQMTLPPGTAIMTGTPSGVGFSRTPPVFLKKGDAVEVTISEIGTLINGVTRTRPGPQI